MKLDEKEILFKKPEKVMNYVDLLVTQNWFLRYGFTCFVFERSKVYLVSYCGV